MKARMTETCRTCRHRVRVKEYGNRYLQFCGLTKNWRLIKGYEKMVSVKDPACEMYERLAIK